MSRLRAVTPVCRQAGASACRHGCKVGIYEELRAVSAAVVSEAGALPVRAAETAGAGARKAAGTRASRRPRAAATAAGLTRTGICVPFWGGTGRTGKLRNAALPAETLPVRQAGLAEANRGKFRKF